jgi:hypothetical protein
MDGLERRRVEIERELALLQRRVRSIGRSLSPDERAQVAEQAAGLRQKLADFYMERMVNDRPEVVSRGEPVSGDAAQRGLEEARARLRGGCPSCPAAQEINAVDGSVSLRCAIEGSILSSKSDPQSLLTFCVGVTPGAYQGCPTWMSQREAELAGRQLEGAVV